MNLKLSLLFLFVLIPFASAGCFLYTSSPQYCRDIPLPEAQSECSSFADCVLSEIYSSNACTGNLACSKITCKSTCQEEYKGLCLTGEIPSGKESEWCSPGCCSLASAKIDFCDFVPNKWRCEIEAQNKEADTYQFKSNQNMQECQELCESKSVLKGFSGEVPIEKIGSPTPVPDPSGAIVIKDFTSQGVPVPSSFSYWWGLVLLVIITAVLWKWKVPSKIKWWDKKLPSPVVEKPTLPKILVPLSDSQRIKEWGNRYKKEVKEKQRKEFLVESGLAPEPITINFLEKLKRVLRRKEKKKAVIDKPTISGKEAFQKLDVLVSPVPKAGPTSEEKAKAIKELKKMARK